MDNLKNSGEELDFNLFVSLIGSYQYKDLKQLKNKITDTQINIKDKDYSIFQKIQHIITQYQEKDINRLNNKISESLNDIIKKEKDNYDNYLIQIIQKIIIDYRDKDLNELKNKIIEIQNNIMKINDKNYSLLQIVQNLITEFIKRENINPKLKESFKSKQISKPSMSNENYLKYIQGKYLLLYTLLKNNFSFSISYKEINNYLKESNVEENPYISLYYEQQKMKKMIMIY